MRPRKRHVKVHAFVECGLFKFVWLSDVDDAGITSRPESGRGVAASQTDNRGFIRAENHAL